MSTLAEPNGFSKLENEQFLCITTFRRDGTEASTPVWFVSDDLRTRLFVATGAETWKVRRIRRNPRVRVAPCTARGKVTGEPLDGIARIVDEGPLVRRLQTEKYGWQKWVIENAYRLAMAVLRRPAGDSVYLEITPLSETTEVPETRAA
jgi:PPOX class probable F420-dependent enzyme